MKQPKRTDVSTRAALVFYFVGLALTIASMSMALDLPARGCAFMICSTVRKASEIGWNEDPREVGFKIDSIQIEFCERETAGRVGALGI